jgi:carboxymethylenebutenolidase
VAVPFTEDFDYWTESVSHTRNLTFLKPLTNGPYFDLEAIWDEHTYYEFADRSVEHTMSTMVDQPYVNHVPTVSTPMHGYGDGVSADEIIAYRWNWSRIVDKLLSGQLHLPEFCRHRT